MEAKHFWELDKKCFVSATIARSPSYKLRCWGANLPAQFSARLVRVPDYIRSGYHTKSGYNTPFILLVDVGCVAANNPKKIDNPQATHLTVDS